MSLADKIFIENCKEIITNGSDTRGEKVRPHWEDGTAAFTIKKFGICNRYDLMEEFPALTLRKTAIKSATDEILWIYQKKSNNINDLNSHIWDQWADKEGSIGTAYGYQIGKKYLHHTITKCSDIPSAIDYPSLDISSKMSGPYNIYLDQIDGVIYDLKHSPFSRRIMTNVYNFDDLHSMNLYPCAYSCTFNVTDDGYNKPRLNLLLNQRSNDMIVANNWNVVQYAVLTMMIAQVCDMLPGVLVHMIADAHIYDRHIPIVNELIKRKEYEAPKVHLNPDIKNFYDFKPDDVIVEKYLTNEQIKNIPVAI